MKILAIVTSLTFGGAERLVYQLSKSFLKEGHSVIVVRLSDARQVGNSIDVEKMMIDEIREAGGETYSLSLANRRNVVAGAIAFRRLMARIGPDLIHAHTAQATLMMAGIRVPIILTHHNTRISFPLWLFPVFDRIVSGYVALSSECSDVFSRYVRKPIETIPNAPGWKISASSPRRLVEGDVSILAVGAVSAQKDYPTLIRAAAHLRRRLAAVGRRAQIRIAGDGVMVAELKALASAEGVGDVIEFLGPRRDIPDLLAQSHLFVNCSLYEGLPLSIIEAMSAGLPIVATDVTGNRLLVMPGRNGLLVPAGNPDALAAAMVQALSSSEAYISMSEAAIEKAAEYPIERCAKGHLMLYQGYLTRKKEQKSPRSIASPPLQES